MAITLRKTIPASDWYTGSGDTIINILGVEEININTKKSLTKITIPQSEGTWSSNNSDKARGYVLDLKRVEDTIKIRGWVEDDSSETAWNKAWKIRAMAVTGGPLTSLIIEGKEFSTSTQQCYIEECNINVDPRDDSGGLSINMGDGTARITVDLTIYVGDPK